MANNKQRSISQAINTLIAMRLTRFFDEQYHLKVMFSNNTGEDDAIYPYKALYKSRNDLPIKISQIDMSALVKEIAAIRNKVFSDNEDILKLSIQQGETENKDTLIENAMKDRDNLIKEKIKAILKKISEKSTTQSYRRYRAIRSYLTLGWYPNIPKIIENYIYPNTYELFSDLKSKDSSKNLVNNIIMDLVYNYNDYFRDILDLKSSLNELPEDLNKKQKIVKGYCKILKSVNREVDFERITKKDKNGEYSVTKNRNISKLYKLKYITMKNIANDRKHSKLTYQDFVTDIKKFSNKTKVIFNKGRIILNKINRKKMFNKYISSLFGTNSHNIINEHVKKHEKESKLLELQNDETNKLLNKLPIDEVVLFKCIQGIHEHDNNKNSSNHILEKLTRDRIIFLSRIEVLKYAKLYEIFTKDGYETTKERFNNIKEKALLSLKKDIKELKGRIKDLKKQKVNRNNKQDQIKDLKNELSTKQTELKTIQKYKFKKRHYKDMLTSMEELPKIYESITYQIEKGVEMPYFSGIALQSHLKILYGNNIDSYYANFDQSFIDDDKLKLLSVYRENVLAKSNERIETFRNTRNMPEHELFTIPIALEVIQEQLNLEQQKQAAKKEIERRLIARKNDHLKSNTTDTSPVQEFSYFDSEVHVPLPPLETIPEESISSKSCESQKGVASSTDIIEESSYVENAELTNNINSILMQRNILKQDDEGSQYNKNNNRLIMLKKFESIVNKCRKKEETENYQYSFLAIDYLFTLIDTINKIISINQIVDDHNKGNYIIDESTILDVLDNDNNYEENLLHLLNQKLELNEILKKVNNYLSNKSREEDIKQKNNVEKDEIDFIERCGDEPTIPIPPIPENPPPLPPYHVDELYECDDDESNNTESDIRNNGYTPYGQRASLKFQGLENYCMPKVVVSRNKSSWWRIRSPKVHPTRGKPVKDINTLFGRETFNSRR